MNKRPTAITVMSAVFLVAGVVGLAYHATEFKLNGPFQYDLVLVFVVRLIAVICAVFMLRAHNWARWLLVIWIAYHVILSAFHSMSQVIVHGLLLVVITYFLFRRSASVCFRGARGESAELNRDSARH